MNKLDLQQILTDHKSWVESEGKEGKHANLREAKLIGTDLSNADLRSANLREADLSNAITDKRYIQISCIGSKKRMTTYCFDDDKIWCGCFIGTLKEFKDAVEETHKNNSQYLKEYLGFIKYIENLKEENK